MTGLPKVRAFPVTGDSLELVRAYHKEVAQLDEKRTALRTEYAGKMKELGEATQARLRELWVRVSASVGLDPETTWGNPAYQIESRYLEHGFAAVLFQEVEPHPMAAVFGAEPEAESADPDEVPKGSTIQ